MNSIKMQRRAWRLSLRAWV